MEGKQNIQLLVYTFVIIQ